MNFESSQQIDNFLKEKIDAVWKKFSTINEDCVHEIQ